MNEKLLVEKENIVYNNNYPEPVPRPYPGSYFHYRKNFFKKKNEIKNERMN